MKGKILKLLFISVAFSVISIPNVFAESIDDRLVMDNGELVKFSTLKPQLCNTDVAEVVFEDPINVDGKNIELLCTFENREEAVESAYNMYADAFDYLYENYNLPTTITPDNWKQFEETLTLAQDDYKNLTLNMRVELNSIGAFLDIYENDDVNSTIKEYVNQYNNLSPLSRSNLSSDFIKLNIDMLTPDYSENFGTITPIFNVNTRVGNNFNVSRAVDYASTYAVNYNNTGEYPYFSGGDCTNFVSQILEYSGVAQVPSNSEASGWWHRKQGNIHTTSQSWRFANVFARYMGITVYTKDLTSFTQGLQAGDFIGYDKGSDRELSHMGFVTKANGTVKTLEYDTGTLCGVDTYYDVKVAQHTSNYHAWTSSSTNGWEELFLSGYTYARVRG